MNNSVSRRDQLAAQMMVCTYTVKQLIFKIGDLEKDTELSNEEKFEQIKNIKLEISKVGVEIDIIKKRLNC
jgi:hypothetical protein